jgi:Tol biopolymer transport system component
LYLSIEKTGKNRQLYYLTLNDEYYDSGLPPGVTSASISPIDGSIVYTLTNSGTDATAVYLRSNESRDVLLIEEGPIYAWPRWSPDGVTIALFRGSAEDMLITLNPETKEQTEVSKVQWNYPPVWSPDGTRIAFVHGGSVFEYGLEKKETERIVNHGSFIQHPTYTADGSTILFSDGQQIWSTQGGTETKITTGPEEKEYPIAF